MKKIFLRTILSILLLIFPNPTMARVDIDVRISLPPPFRFVEPPELVVLPGTYVYTAPDLEIDIFFYDGWWWRSWDNRWYRSREYDSGWVYYESTPSFYREIPADWRSYYRERRWHGREWNYRRIAYKDVHRNWRDWERDRYWEHQQSWGVKGFRFPLSRGGDVGVSVGLPLPPPIVFVEPPRLIVLPGTYVYAVPDVEVDIFFHDGWWWRSWENRWYRSREYSSGWVYYQSAPSFYREIPREWRTYCRERRWLGNEWNYELIPFHQVQVNWRAWEKNRHWERQRTWGVRDFQNSGAQQPYHKVKSRYNRQQYIETSPPSHLQHRETGPSHKKGGKLRYLKEQRENRGHGHGKH